MLCKIGGVDLLTGECRDFQSRVKTEIEGRRIDTKNRIDLLRHDPNLISD